MAYPKIRSAAAVCAIAVLALSSQVPAQNAPNPPNPNPAISHVKNTGAQPVLKTGPVPSVKSCPAGYQGTPPNCAPIPHWDVTKNKRS